MKNSTCFKWSVFLVALAVGGAIAWVDSRPHWDDAGITAMAILATTFVLGALRPPTAWLSALAVGAWIPAVGILRHGNYSMLLVLAFAFAGAYAGAFGRKLLGGGPTTSSSSGA